MTSECEDLDELEKTVLSLCADDDNTVIEAENETTIFHFSPSKLAGIQLPVLTETSLTSASNNVGTPLSISRLSPIKKDKYDSIDAPRFSPFTPATMRCTRRKISQKENFCSTPCNHKASSTKRLKLNKTAPNITEEPNETFEDLLHSVYQLCEGKSSKKPRASVSQIDLDTIFQNGENTNNTSQDVTIQPEYDMIKDGEYFKTVNETGSPYRGRFRGLSYSRSVVEDESDSDQDLSIDILGLDKFIVLDDISDDDDDDDTSQLDQPNKTFYDGPTVAVAKNDLDTCSLQESGKNKELQNTLTGNQSKIAIENITDSEKNVNSESAHSPKVSKTSETQEQIKETASIVSVKRKASELSTNDAKEEPKNKERKLGVIKKESCCEENESKPTTPLVHDIRIIVLASPKNSVSPDDDNVFEAVTVEPSIDVVDLTETSQVDDQPIPTLDSDLQTAQKKVESDMIEKMKACWNKGNLRDVVNANSNLTSCGYMRRRYPKDQWSTLTSALEGNSRIPPLFRNEKSTNSSLDTQGRSPMEIAREIGEQISNIEKDCARKLQMIEGRRTTRVHQLTMSHRQQVNVLRQKQTLEMRNLMRSLSNRPFTAFSEMQQNRLENEHSGQRFDLGNLHGQEMRALCGGLDEEKQKIKEESKVAKNNLQHMIDKLKATSKQNAVHPDHVHTTIDLLKGPCRSNGNKPKLVPVCLPADIATYMVREDKIYDMYYRHT